MRVLALGCLAFAALFAVRPLGAGDEARAKVKAAAVLRAFEVIEHATGASEFETDDEPDNALHHSFSDEAALALLKRHNESARIADVGMLRYDIDPKTSVIVRNYDKSGLQLRFIVDKGAFTFETMNEWNRNRRPTKAYISADETTTLELDILTSAGVTHAVVANALSFFEAEVGRYRTHLTEGAK